MGEGVLPGDYGLRNLVDLLLWDNGGLGVLFQKFVHLSEIDHARRHGCAEFCGGGHGDDSLEVFLVDAQTLSQCCDVLIVLA